MRQRRELLVGLGMSQRYQLWHEAISDRQRESYWNQLDLQERAEFLAGFDSSDRRKVWNALDRKQRNKYWGSLSHRERAEFLAGFDWSDRQKV